MKEPFTPIEFAPGLWRGRRPYGDEWEQLGRLGIHTIIDLQEISNPPWLSFNYTNIKFPLSSILPPRTGQVKEILECIASRPDYQRPIFIHCKSGVDRTGFIVARWRMKVQNWNRKRAVREMIRMGNHWWLRWWTWFV